MENASKALIIAGAILLSIAIIGIGMYVYQMAAGTIYKVNMSGSEITAYNAEFDKYEGTQTGTNVRALLNTVRAHNMNINGDDASKMIVVSNGTTYTGADREVADAELTGTTTAEINAVLRVINTGTRYNVTFAYTTTGLIKAIGINPR